MLDFCVHKLSLSAELCLFMLESRDLVSFNVSCCHLVPVLCLFGVV